MDTTGNTNKDIRQYLHLYLGCECMIGDLNWKREEHTYGLMPDVDLDYGKPIKSTLDAHVLNAFAHKTTLILRPLSDMTEEEEKEVNNHGSNGWRLINPDGDCKTNKALHLGVVHRQAAEVTYLLSRGFDLFGLIEAGLAIDKTTLKQEA